MKLICSISGLVLAASAAHAQPAIEPAGESAAADAHGAAHATETTAPAEAAPPAQAAGDAAAPAALAVADVSEAEIDSFAKATVKLQAIQADATIAADQKQAAMQAAVSEAGLDPAKYNAIGKAAQADPALRARVQTAMTRYASPPPSDG